MPALRKLYLTDNKIKIVNGLEGLSSLTHLSLRANQVENFDESFPSLENLQYLNLRENKIEKFEEIQKLTVLVALDSLVISFNPIINKMQEKFYFELMNIMSKIKRINKVKVNDQVR